MSYLSPHPADWLPLAPNGDPAKWWFDPPHLRIAEGAWVFTDNELRGEVGGMSWDNYILSAQVLIHRRAEDAHFQVELTAVGTNVYCQFLPPCIVLAYFSQEKHGTDFFGKSPPLTPEDGVWQELAMQAQNGVITVCSSTAARSSAARAPMAPKACLGSSSRSSATSRSA